MQPREDYVLKLLEEAGLVTRSQIDKAKARLNGSGNVVELLIKDGTVSDAIHHSFFCLRSPLPVDLVSDETYRAFERRRNRRPRETGG